MTGAAPTERQVLRRSHYITDKAAEWGEHSFETYLDALARQRAEKPDAIFLDCQGRTYTFAEIDALSTRMANGLAALGVAKGRPVATILGNHEDCVLTLFAVNKLGGIWVPINTAYKGEFLRHQIADCGATVVICDDAYLENLLGVLDQLPAMCHILVRGAAPAAHWQKTARGSVVIASLDTARAADETAIALTVTQRDIACLLYTSGTTGPSKGCMISYGYLSNLGRQRNRSVPPQKGRVTWSCLPLIHIAALGTVLISSLLAGERVSIAERFSVSGFWDEIERSGAGSAMLLASMFPLLAQAPDNPAMLRCRGQLEVVTGVPLTPADRKIWQERFGVGTMNTFAYGQTEATMITFLPWGEGPAPMDSMGPPAAEFEVMVMGEDQLPVPIGRTGELVVRPRQPGVMFSGYWNRPQDTVNAMEDLWWHTGDFVRMDENGYLYFVDRKKDYLRSRGENISSFEVENAIMKHPAVSEVACHAIAGEGLEEDIKATLVLRQQGTVTEEEFFHWAVETLPYFAVPRFVEFRADLPKTPTGRFQKHLLRDEGLTRTTWDARAAGFEIRRAMPRARSAGGRGNKA